MTRYHHPYTVTSTTPTPGQAATRLRQLALNAGDDAHKGIGSGSWLIERHHDAQCLAMGADALNPNYRSFTCHSWSTVTLSTAELEKFGFVYRITSGVDLSDEFHDGTGWLIEVLNAQKGAGNMTVDELIAALLEMTELDPTAGGWDVVDKRGGKVAGITHNSAYEGPVKTRRPVVLVEWTS